jgi:hypothetical protein
MEQEMRVIIWQKNFMGMTVWKKGELYLNISVEDTLRACEVNRTGSGYRPV